MAKMKPFDVVTTKTLIEIIDGMEYKDVKFGDGSINRLRKVTPDLAKLLLNKETINRCNRSVSTAQVKLYADAMSTGKWKENSEPIVFVVDSTSNRHMTVSSGQHRLYAVVEANTPIWFNFRYMTADEAVYVDTAKKRTILDNVIMSQHMKSDDKRRLIWYYQIKQRLDGVEIKKSTNSIEDLLKEYSRETIIHGFTALSPYIRKNSENRICIGKFNRNLFTAFISILELGKATSKQLDEFASIFTGAEIDDKYSILISSYDEAGYTKNVSPSKEIEMYIALWNTLNSTDTVVYSNGDTLTGITNESINLFV